MKVNVVFDYVWYNERRWNETMQSVLIVDIVIKIVCHSHEAHVSYVEFKSSWRWFEIELMKLQRIEFSEMHRVECVRVRLDKRW